MNVFDVSSLPSNKTLRNIILETRKVGYSLIVTWDLSKFCSFWHVCCKTCIAMQCKMYNALQAIYSDL